MRSWERFDHLEGEGEEVRTSGKRPETAERGIHTSSQLDEVYRCAIQADSRRITVMCNRHACMHIYAYNCECILHIQMPGMYLQRCTCDVCMHMDGVFIVRAVCRHGYHPIA